jgi:ubiquinone/menaquinone biosynthesis C-methylase UbiE
MIGAVAPAEDDEIVDIGGGASTLVDRLLQRGFKNLTVVDISESALNAIRTRLGSRAVEVTWLVADARDLHFPRQVALWHDRAVFHFLTKQADQDAYLSCLHEAVRPGGHVIMATFGPQGPNKCSGLPVERYDAPRLSGRLGPSFALLRSLEKIHTTPGGTTQQFTYCLFRRRD